MPGRAARGTRRVVRRDRCAAARACWRNSQLAGLEVGPRPAGDERGHGDVVLAAVAARAASGRPPGMVMKSVALLLLADDAPRAPRAPPARGHRTCARSWKRGALDRGSVGRQRERAAIGAASVPFPVGRARAAARWAVQRVTVPPSVVDCTGPEPGPHRQNRFGSGCLCPVDFGERSRLLGRGCAETGGRTRARG